MSARPLLELKDRHRGADVYVLGSAASMAHFDPEFFRGRLVIGCNWVFRDFPCTYAVWKEAPADAIRQHPGTIVAKHPHGNTGWAATDYGANVPDHWVFPHRMNGHTHVDWSVLGTDEIVVSYSTITSAMHIAAYLGAANIFLAGVDGGKLDGRMQYEGYPGAEEHHAWYSGWVREILPQTLTLRDKLREVYGCRVYLLSPFLNFQLEGHKFEA